LILVGSIFDLTPVALWRARLPPVATVLTKLIDLMAVESIEDNQLRQAEAVVATLARPGTMSHTDNLTDAILRCFENKRITHMFPILLSTNCNLNPPGEEQSLLYRVIDLLSWNVNPIRYNQMFEVLLSRGADPHFLSSGDQADIGRVGIDALTKAVSLLHTESISIMLRHGIDVQPRHQAALFQLVTRGDVVILDKNKYLETFELLLAYGASISDDDWSNMGPFVKEDGKDLHQVGEVAERLSNNRLNGIFEVTSRFLGTNKRIRDCIESYLVQFRKEEFFTGLSKFLIDRQTCLRSRFPEVTRAAASVEQSQRKSRDERDKKQKDQQLRDQKAIEKKSKPCMIM